MPTFSSRLDLYGSLARDKDKLLDEARHIGKGLDIPAELRGSIGASGCNSALPGTIRNDIFDAMRDGMMRVRPVRDLGDEIRRLVKSVYGDDYDAAPTNSCEAALLIAYECLFSPPSTGRGDPYRSRVIGLVERHAEHQLSYGRPFPPMYKDLFADRGATAGELGLLGRRLENTDCIFVPMAGARYDLHGIKFHPTPLLMGCDYEATVKAVENAARIHERDLTGFVSLGYDTPGYGYGEHDNDGAPLLLIQLSQLAKRRGLPFLCDNAWGMPFIGTDIRKIGADVMLYSMDKVSGSPTSGLVIGKEFPVASIRRALGIHSERFGTVSAHGKAGYVHADPGKMAMLGMIAALRVLRDNPARVTVPIDETEVIVRNEFERIKGRLPEGIHITKSYNLGGIEINYERTWMGPNGTPIIGIPIFNTEDRIAGSQLLAQCITAMGILPGQSDDGNIIINPGLGTTDDEGRLIPERMQAVVRGVFESLALFYRYISENSSQELHHG